MIRYLILTFLILSFGIWLFADAASIRTGVLANIHEFQELRTPEVPQGNLYESNGNAIISVSYDLAPFEFSSGPKYIQTTYYTSVTLVFSDYPEDNKIFVDWGDNGATSTVFGFDKYIGHQYASQLQSYNVTIKTYRPSGSSYIEEPEHEVNYIIGIFPEEALVSFSTDNDNTIGQLSQYLSTVNSGIKKPILIVEGFDMSNSNTTANIIGMNPYFYQSLLTEGYDLFFLTFTDTHSSLYVNSGLVLSALEAIKTLYEDGGALAGFGCKPIKVIGYSMGGILARIALASAEDQDGFSHGANLLLTVDSPHRGLVINSNLQEKIESIANLLSDRSGVLDGLTRLSSSPIARQFIRNNIHANTLEYDFIDGSNEYTNVFDFLNPCDAHNVVHINQDWDSYNSGNYNPQLDFKSGFPWKQNNIRNYAVAFGSHEPSGNTGGAYNFASIRAKGWFLMQPWTYPIETVVNKWYDTCPGSFFPTELHLQQAPPASTGIFADYINWIIDACDVIIKINVNYDLPVVPVISSLCITNRQFAEEWQTQYTPFDQVIAEPLQTPFSQYFIPTEASSHQVLSPQVATWIQNSIVDNPTTTGKIGHISGIMRHGTELLVNHQFMITNLRTGTIFNASSDATGCLQINNLFVNTCEYEIKHLGGLYYPRVIAAEVDMFGNSDIGTVYFTSPSNVINVSQSPTSNACHTISDAIHMSVVTGISHIKVYPGTYEDNLDFFPLFEAGTENFTLEGIGDVTIIGSGIGLNLELNQESQVINAIYNLTNLTISGFDRGIFFKDSIAATATLPYSPRLTLNVKNCNFDNCGFIGDAVNPFISSAAIHFEGPGKIENCEFTNNTADGSGSSPNPSYIAGALYINNNSQNTASVIDCVFKNNTGGQAGALVVTGIGESIILNNSFRENGITDSYEPLGHRANDLFVFNTSNTKIMHNLFEGDQGTSIGLQSYTGQTSQTLNDVKFYNNTMSYNTVSGINPFNALVFDIYSTPSVQNIQIYNNVFMNNEPNIVKISKSTGHQPTIFENNILHNVTTTETGFVLNSTDPTMPLYNHFCDPQLGLSYIPIWDQYSLSPCIDTGSGDEFDPDGTPPDIGAFSALEHQHWEYAFENQADVDKWYWVSYPILNSITDNALVASEFFQELLLVHEKMENGQLVPHPTYLEHIAWMDQGDSQNITWDSEFFAWSTDVDNHNITSPQGYKIKLQSRSNSNNPSVSLRESGYKTPDNLEFQIYGGCENWLGYFKEESLLPHVAFADIWEDITMIKTKNWSLIRTNPIGDYYGMNGKVSSLSLGDMVIVTTNNNHTFAWGSGPPEIPPVKELPKNFVFNELEDYIPMYISLPDSLISQISEIGLYVDGVCKGAVVVDDNLEQISAYVESPNQLSEGEVELVIYQEDSKGMANNLRSMSLSQERLQPKYGRPGALHPYFEVKITTHDMNNTIPAEFSLKQNYPNPFNPDTTISYSLPEPGIVRLDIYNIKGQLVKTLVNTEHIAGYHSVVWNGKDMNNKTVASGVYFYRISSFHKTQTRKMLLMK